VLAREFVAFTNKEQFKNMFEHYGVKMKQEYLDEDGNEREEL